MSIQTQTHETVSDEPTDDHPSIDLNKIVAQTVPLGEQFPDFDEFSAVCKATTDTIKRIMAQDRPANDNDDHPDPDAGAAAVVRADGGELAEESTGIVVNCGPLTLSDGGDVVVFEGVEADVGLGHRVSVVDGEMIDEDVTREPQSTHLSEEDGRIEYRERGDGQPVTEWRFAKRSNRGVSR